MTWFSALRRRTTSNADTPVVKDLLLVGGGHSHVAVLKRFGMRPLPGVRVTLICRDAHTPYSGMLPGYIAGHYEFDEAHIDLEPLSRFAGARFYHDEVTGVDPDERGVHCRNRHPVSYDVLSINIGSTPRVSNVPGAEGHVVPVKPINNFIGRWRQLVERVTAEPGELHIGIVGGGAGGVELTLAAHHRLRELLQARGDDPDRLHFHLFSADPAILSAHSPGVQRRFMRTLASRGIKLYGGEAVERVEGRALTTSRGTTVPCDEVLWVTAAGGAAWLKESGLSVDDGGFMRVGRTLQSVSHPDIFGAGDIAAMDGHPRPKAGVFAVRMGPPLARNLKRYLSGKAPRGFRPQRRFLSLISTGDRYAVASRGPFGFEGAWVWRWKNWIDQRFMAKYRDLPVMETDDDPGVAHGVADKDAMKEISAIAMRCGGCGAKVGSTVLSRALARLTPVERDDVIVGLHAPDDAAVVRVPPGKHVVHSVDFFRAIVDDPYVLGQVAANHSLGDLYAMNAEPQTALAMATVPYGLERKVEDTIYQMMAGALRVLDEAHTALAGGHTGEGAELSLGFAVNGLVDAESLLRKGGMRAGDALVLTKALGTGTLFAADMRYKAKGRWIEAALASMIQSNFQGAQCLHRHGATACTDVTGFGLLGHLVEMIRPSGADVELDLGALPLLDGAEETVRQGILSSLQPANVRLRRAIRNMDEIRSHERYPLLFDPQTSGGLLASVPTERVESCVAELRRLGYGDTRVIGKVLPESEALEPVTLVA